YVQELDESFDYYIEERAYIEGKYFDGDDAKASSREQRWRAKLEEKEDKDFSMDRLGRQESFGFEDGASSPQFDPLDRWSW
ncbi:unnamed protein product, partial [marine sediment metagenome]